MSFRVSSVAGAEDLSVRVLTNPSTTDVMRVDYFQLLRKWQVDLIRYGLRMTYDIVIPNPGRDLIGRTLEIQAINRTLTTSSYQFGVTIDEVTPEKWLDYSQQYGVELDPPPDPLQPIAFYKKLDVAGEGVVTGDVEIDIPEGYKFDTGSFSADAHLNVTTGQPRPLINALGLQVGPKSDAEGDQYNVALSALLGREATGHQGTGAQYQHTVGKLLIPYAYQNTSDGEIIVTRSAKLLQKTIDGWQLKSWIALRDADQAAYAARSEQAKERKAYLEAEIAKFDALTLRKMEREEVMRWVLQWLLGPGFDLMPDDIYTMLEYHGCTHSDPDPCTGNYADPQPSQYAYPKPAEPEPISLDVAPRQACHRGGGAA